jgi:microcystin degradation protein MlrC
MRIIVSAKRKGYHFEKDFTNLGLDIRNADIVMVKLGYLTEELYDIQADWMMALTKGGVDQDLLELPYKGINRPMYPLDPDMDDPSFEVVFL